MNDKGGVNFTPKIFKTSFSSNKDKVVVQYKYRQFNQNNFNKFNDSYDNNLLFACYASGRHIERR